VTPSPVSHFRHGGGVSFPSGVSFSCHRWHPRLMPAPTRSPARSYPPPFLQPFLPIVVLPHPPLGGAPCWICGRVTRLTPVWLPQSFTSPRGCTVFGLLCPPLLSHGFWRLVSSLCNVSAQGWKCPSGSVLFGAQALLPQLHRSPRLWWRPTANRRYLAQPALCLGPIEAPLGGGPLPPGFTLAPPRGLPHYSPGGASGPPLVYFLT